MIKTIKNINLKNKRVLVRVDYNVSLLANCQIADDFRLEQSLPTLRHLIKKNCTVFLLSHLGRPACRSSACAGRPKKQNKKYSLQCVALQLRKLLKRKVYFYNRDYTTKEAREELKQYHPKDIILLENIRFYPGEEENDQRLSKKLSLLADVFVNDAFGVCHRHHASIVGIPQYLPSAAGLLLDKEIKVISKAVNRPRKPMVAIIGGAKIKSKLKVLNKLVGKADYCLVGGRLANALLKIKKAAFEYIKIDRETKELVKHVCWQASSTKTALILPVDAVVIKQTVGDIGPKTRENFKQIISQAKTIIWVGPMGIYERKEFSQGTEVVYEAIAHNRESLSIVGGGDTMAALKHKHYLKTIDHVSTGGGAMLEFIEKGTLPGIEVLKGK